MKSYEHVLSPIQIGPMKLKNRVSFSPVWPSFATADGHVNRELMEWVRAIVKGGVSCINIGCGLVNHFVPKEIAHLLRLGEESVVNEMSMLCDLVHLYNCKIGMELFAINISGESFETRDQHGKEIEVEVDPTDLSHEQIKELIEDFANAAHRAMRCGVDSLVVHGAHGQLPGCFLSKRINRRTDEYGTDSMENRARFTNELLQAIRDKVGNHVAIEYRINADDMISGSPSIEEVIEFVKTIENKIDLLHVSRGMHSMQNLAPYINQPLYFNHGINLEDAATIKAAVHVPVTVVGSVTLEQAEESIAAGKIDMVSMARGLMADPEMVNNAKRGMPEHTRPCIRCNNCIQRTHYLLAPVRCAVNAEMGMETLYGNILLPVTKKKIAVIGGGPAGMEAARTAARRGNQVVLFEKTGQLGGVLKLAAVPSFKADIRNYLEWAVCRTQEEENVEIRLNTEAAPETICKEGFDAVIVSVGATPVIPSFMAHSSKAVWVGDVETGQAQVGKEVIVIGAGLTGCESALELVRKGKNVTLADMISEKEFGSGGAKFNQIAIVNLLKDAGVKFAGGIKLLDITDEGTLFEDAGGEKIVLPCDTAVLSLGVRPDTAVAEAFFDCAVDVINVGDCMARQGTLYNAVHTGHQAAVTL